MFVDSRDSVLACRKMDLLKDVFSFPVEKMVAFSDYVKSQMVDGLSGKESDLKMVPSFVNSLMSGSG